MKVRMKVGISGTRSGQDWPGPGGVLDVDDEEGAELCAGGLAEPVVEDKTETATAPAAEQRAEKPKPAKKTT